MNYKIVFNTVGKVLRVEGILMLLPALVGACYQELWPCLSFVITAIAVFALGMILIATCKTDNQLFFAKEGLEICL